MVSVSDYYNTLRNYKNMSGIIENSDLPDKERLFLEKSLKNTCAFEKGYAGKYYYNLGGGKDYIKEVLSLCGDYLFMIRVLDNVIDGHITGKGLDRKLTKEMLDSLVDFISYVDNEKNIRDELPYIEGLEGSLKIAEIFRDDLEVYPVDKEQFITDFIGLSKGGYGGGGYNNPGDYEKNLKFVGSYMHLTLVDLIETFPDFMENKSEDVRRLVSLLGIVAQIKDDISDGDKGISEPDLVKLLTKYKFELDSISEVIGEKYKINLLNKLYPLSIWVTDSKIYKGTRNNLLNKLC